MQKSLVYTIIVTVAIATIIWTSLLYVTYTNPFLKKPLAVITQARQDYTLDRRIDMTAIEEPQSTSTTKVAASREEKIEDVLPRYKNKVVVMWFGDYPALVTKKSIELAKNETGNGTVFDCEAGNKPLVSGYVLFKCSPDFKSERVLVKYDPVNNILKPYLKENQEGTLFAKMDMKSTATTDEGVFSIGPIHLYFKPFDGATTTIRESILRKEGMFKLLRSYTH